MKLMTKEIEKKFEKYPLKSQDGKGMDAEVVVKFFNPMGVGTWIITEGEQVEDDFIMFGYCDLGFAEWGTVSLNELKAINLPMGLKIERDKHIKKGAKVKDLI